ncbi:MAG: GHMP kinase [Lachnospiraceae bacterium]|nr:GHMP kinase [Lachnospiraceae bacterium]
MIITRTPFRMSFAGGGSDIASFYEKHGGCVLSTTINKYMYISVHPSFESMDTVLKYSQTEIVNDVNEINHKYFKEVLNMLRISGVEITSTADVPAGTGLGSSSSFTVGLLHALYSYKGKFVSKEKLAQKACEIEIEHLKNPIGKQDQYAAAYGGLNYYQFNKDGSVFVEPIIMKNSMYQQLEKNLMMFYTGQLHSASKILKEQSGNITSGDKEANQLRMCELARELKDELQHNNIDAMGEILHEGWTLKRTLANGISNPVIDEYYDVAMKHGAIGGKLLGAGGGGFLLFYVPEKRQQEVRLALNLTQMPIALDTQGSAVIYVGLKPDIF